MRETKMKIRPWKCVLNSKSNRLKPMSEKEDMGLERGNDHEIVRDQKNVIKMTKKLSL